METYNHFSYQNADPKMLEELGYKVIRFSNERVLYDIDNVVKEIKSYLQ